MAPVLPRPCLFVIHALKILCFAGEVASSLNLALASVARKLGESAGLEFRPSGTGALLWSQREEVKSWPRNSLALQGQGAEGCQLMPSCDGQQRQGP